MLTNIVKNISNIPGWSTKRKIVVIESDDWGSIRMPSREAYLYLQSEGLKFTGEYLRYNQYDTLASSEDFYALFDVLQKFKDKNDNHPVFTPVSLVANPDFEKIKQHDFQEYFYEPFTVTLKKYGQEDAFTFWQEGIKKRLFVPQFHAREHLNIASWMRALQSNNEHALKAFDKGLWGFVNDHPFGLNYQSTFDLEHEKDLVTQAETITSGLKLFYELFGYKASFFVPPNGPINNSLEKTAFEGGIRYISTPKIQHEVLGEGKTRKRFHYLGQKNKLNQYYITRNCFFEPSDSSKDWVESCLNDIRLAFKWNKPAVISSHRINFIGGLDMKNRENGLASLQKLLSFALKEWEDIEFMTSAELGDLISGKNNKV
jgi:hypothetical protein